MEPPKGKERATCPHCGKDLNKAGLGKHIKLCTSDGQKKFDCYFEGCKSAFKTYHDLNNHVSCVHKEPIPCTFPGCSILVKPASLTQHIKNMHENLKDTCSHCGKELRKKTLEKHILNCKTTGQRHFCCKIEGCKMSFKTDQQRKSHVGKVHREKVNCPYENCNALMKPSYISEHVRNIHKKKELGTCDHCGEVLLKSDLPGHFETCKSYLSRDFDITDSDCEIIEDFISNEVGSIKSQIKHLPDVSVFNSKSQSAEAVL